ncbi:MAG: ExbD/TolR family protein [Planctomycetota bacterium]|jgi:biopolymer transport protein ExbD
MRRTRILPKPLRPNLTPMVDMTFLLLVFFLCSMNFNSLEGTLDGALPKDRGIPNWGSYGDRLDLVMFVDEPGTLDPDAGGINPSRLDYRDRRIRIEVGTRVVYFHPSGIEDPKDPIPELSALIKSWEGYRQIPCTIDPRSGTTYGEVVVVLDLATRLGIEEITFAAYYGSE